MGYGPSRTTDLPPLRGLPDPRATSRRERQAHDAMRRLRRSRPSENGKGHGLAKERVTAAELEPSRSTNSHDGVMRRLESAKKTFTSLARDEARFLALRGGDQLLGPFNRELVVYRKQNLSISNNCLVDLDALLAHGSTFDHAASRPYFYYDCEDDWFQ